MAGRVAILDGDVIAYMGAYGSKQTVEWDDGETTNDVDLDLMREIIDETVLQWTKLVKCDRAIVAQSCPDRVTFRSGVHPNYKKQRSPQAKPVNLTDAEKYIAERYEARSFRGLEGDDVMGIIATRRPNECVVVSTDKDMLTLPVRVCIIQARGPIEQSAKYHLKQDEADYNWMIQTVAGDPADNYLGAPGIGKTTARKMVAPMALDVMWRQVIIAYMDAWENRLRYRDRWINPGEPETEALMNARCARILRDGDYNDGKVRLWTPHGEGEWVSCK